MFVSEECPDSPLERYSGPRDFATGQLVWGQIRGFPSWPGKLVNEEDVTVKSNHKTEMGKVWPALTRGQHYCISKSFSLKCVD